jgi:hypothetical protein
MDIALKLTSAPGSTNFRSGLMNDIETSLDRFKHRLKRVRVFIEDVNGPKGGDDKVVRFVAELRHMPEIVVCEQAGSVRKAVGSATKRVKRILAERVNHRGKQRIGRS